MFATANTLDLFSFLHFLIVSLLSYSAVGEISSLISAHNHNSVGAVRVRNI